METRPILGRFGYTATIDGRVLSRRVPHGLSPRLDKSGYLKVDLGRRRTVSVHRLVWEAFNGTIPQGHEINHRNGNKQDNRLENLELLTRSQNMAHAYASGLMRKRKIQSPDGADAFTRYLCERGPAGIAAAAGVSQALVYAWIHGRSKPRPEKRLLIEKMMGHAARSCTPMISRAQ